MIHSTSGFLKQNQIFIFNGNDIKVPPFLGNVINLRRDNIKNKNKLKLTIDLDIPDSKIPLFPNLKDFIDLEFYGKMWKPSNKAPLNELFNVERLVIPPGDIPLKINAKVINLTLSGNATIHGDVLGSYTGSTYKMAINSSVTAKTLITFKSYTSIEITIMSPYIDLDIVKYKRIKKPFNGQLKFPIGFSLNEHTYSKVKINELVYDAKTRKEKITTKTYMMLYPTITTAYSDEELKKIDVLSNGFTFLDFPNDILDLSHFEFLIDTYSPSAQQGIPGFTGPSMCLGINMTKSKTYLFSAKITRTAYGYPSYICISKDNLKCNPAGQKLDLYEPYTHVSEIKDGNIAQYVSNGSKDIIIFGQPTGNLTELDFNTLPDDGYNVTIGSSYEKRRFQFIIKAAPGKLTH